MTAHGANPPGAFTSPAAPAPGAPARNAPSGTDLRCHAVSNQLPVPYCIHALPGMASRIRAPTAPYTRPHTSSHPAPSVHFLANPPRSTARSPAAPHHAFITRGRLNTLPSDSREPTSTPPATSLHASALCQVTTASTTKSCSISRAASPPRCALATRTSTLYLILLEVRHPSGPACHATGHLPPASLSVLVRPAA